MVIMYKFLHEHLKEGDYVLDVGSRITEGSIGYNHLIKVYSNVKCNYVGLDIEKGDNVDVVVDPCKWNIKSNFFDIVISGQTLEHCKFFWLTFKEMARVLKKGGYMCVVVPKIQKQHKYPVDCWRFYPDSMDALAEWGKLKCIHKEAEHWDYRAFPHRPIDCFGIFQK